jgi:hydrogenase maturation protein HypF
MRGLRLKVRGSVQGVGFRPWVWRVAHSLGLQGVVFNAADGVEIQVFGPQNALDAFRAQLEQPPGSAVVETIEGERLTTEAPAEFKIIESEPATGGRPADVPLAPDLPTCDACLEELADPASRRYRHPFIACAECGPRYTVVRELPYDRARTAMDAFPLCPSCAVEYGNPEDRRFHAEATSCPACGPTLRCLSSTGEVVARQQSALAQAVDVLTSGGIVAVHGIGGFHLACDATCEAAVQLLRDRKQRPAKAFAVMVPSIEVAEKHAIFSREERELMTSPVRPIVLLHRREDSNLAHAVAPGSPMLGLFLPYTPLHTLLLGGSGMPLVMTSANRSGEPIAFQLEESFETLASLSDAILTHDREVVAACDDSVVMPAANGPIVFRRSRGYVPRPIRLAQPLPRPVLAYGGQWNNTICLARDDRAWLSGHVGDLDSPESVTRLAETVLRWQQWLGFEPEVIACDLHPGYESTRLARERSGIETIGIQHHHAHMAAVLAEHGVEGPALGLIWDGTGDGGDGTAWGGELLWGDIGSVQRLATFRPISLAGGERAIREPWRLALAMLDDAFDHAPPLAAIPLFEQIEVATRERVQSLLRDEELCAKAHGVGRYFDAVGALLLMRPFATFQGELALGLNFLCSQAEANPYRFSLERDETPWKLDMRPAVRELVEDLLAGKPPSAIADRFHATLIEVGVRLVSDGIRLAPSQADQQPGKTWDKRPGSGPDGDGPSQQQHTVVLGGGCFQNRVLLDGLERRLAIESRVLRPQRIPPGDGGLALGQALAASRKT